MLTAITIGLCIAAIPANIRFARRAKRRGNILLYLIYLGVSATLIFVVIRKLLKLSIGRS